MNRAINRIKDNELYGLKTLIKVLKSLGLPNTYQWLRRIEKRSLIPSPRNPSSNVRVYNGQTIKEIVSIISGGQYRARTKKLRDTAEGKSS